MRIAPAHPEAALILLMKKEKKREEKEKRSPGISEAFNGERWTDKQMIGWMERRKG